MSSLYGNEPTIWVSPTDLRAWQREKAGEIWAFSENVEGECVPLYLRPEVGEPVCWLYKTQAGTVEFAEQFDEDVYSFPVYPHPPTHQVIPPHVRDFLGKVQGVCMGVAMSGDDHPNPDGVLMDLVEEAQELLFPTAAAELSGHG